MDKTTNILIVEDEVAISRLISLELEHEGYATTVTADGREGLDLALANNYDLIILDIMLPSMSGSEVLRRLRREKQTPVIVLTARDQVVDRVNGLDAGANDYMTKPFATEELLARIRACLRRNGPSDSIKTYGKLQCNPDSRIVTYDGNVIELTKTEFDLLYFLLDNRNTVMSRDKILDAVWGYETYASANNVDVFVRYLRSKIDDKYGITVIQTVWGAGYVIR